MMYSQNEEQQYILSAVEGTTMGGRGRFLDIGAWHPKTFSNTRALFELGWAGVLIEPSPVPLLNLMEEYGKEPRVAIIAAAVGFESHCKLMDITDDGLSTSDAAHLAKWKDAAEWRGRLWVPQLTLEQISTQFDHFDFISIDAAAERAR